MELTVTQRRGGRFETEHPIHAVLWGPEGVRERIGAPLVTTWRSAAKPFQLEVSLDLLGLDLPARMLAVGASSHHAQPLHVDLVLKLLARLDCDVHDLFCGPHWPIDDDASRALVAQGLEATALHNNCSGKHAFMAGACRACGWERDYRDPEHPLQRRIRANIDARTGGACEGAVVDGCGVPCFVVSLEGMARAWSHVGGDGTLGRIGSAMRAHWLEASGATAQDGAVMRDATRPVVAKVGAAGLICGAIPEEGVGFALKCRTGDEDARAIGLKAALDAWFPGLLPDETFAEQAVVRNCVGAVVGERSWEL